MNGLDLGSSHISGIVWDHNVVDGELGGSGEIGAIDPLVILLIHDEARQIVDSLLHIVR